LLASLTLTPCFLPHFLPLSLFTAPLYPDRGVCACGRSTRHSDPLNPDYHLGSSYQPPPAPAAEMPNRRTTERDLLRVDGARPASHLPTHPPTHLLPMWLAPGVGLSLPDCRAQLRQARRLDRSPTGSGGPQM
jgi:hypothetical protein